MKKEINWQEYEIFVTTWEESYAKAVELLGLSPDSSEEEVNAYIDKHHEWYRDDEEACTNGRIPFLRESRLSPQQSAAPSLRTAPPTAACAPQGRNSCFVHTSNSKISTRQHCTAALAVVQFLLSFE